MSWGEGKKSPDGFCILLMVAWCLKFQYNFFSLPPSSLALSLASSCCVFLVSDKMHCYLLVYCISRLDSIRTQEIVQVALSFNLIKAQQDLLPHHDDLHGTYNTAIFFFFMFDDEAVVYVD